MLHQIYIGDTKALKRISKIKAGLLDAIDKVNLFSTKIEHMLNVDPENHSFTPFSEDPTIRKMVTHPFPIFLASTFLKDLNLVEAGEFVSRHPVPIGKQGMNLIYTDTEEHVKQIQDSLPENLRDEVQVKLLDEFIALSEVTNDVLCWHSPEVES